MIQFENSEITSILEEESDSFQIQITSVTNDRLDLKILIQKGDDNAVGNVTFRKVSVEKKNKEADLFLTIYKPNNEYIKSKTKNNQPEANSNYEVKTQLEESKRTVVSSPEDNSESEPIDAIDFEEAVEETTFQALEGGSDPAQTFVKADKPKPTIKAEDRTKYESKLSKIKVKSYRLELEEKMKALKRKHNVEILSSLFNSLWINVYFPRLTQSLVDRNERCFNDFTNIDKPIYYRKVLNIQALMISTAKAPSGPFKGHELVWKKYVRDWEMDEVTFILNCNDFANSENPSQAMYDYLTHPDRVVEIQKERQNRIVRINNFNKFHSRAKKLLQEKIENSEIAINFSNQNINFEMDYNSFKSDLVVPVFYLQVYDDVNIQYTDTQYFGDGNNRNSLELKTPEQFSQYFFEKSQLVEKSLSKYDLLSIGIHTVVFSADWGVNINSPGVLTVFVGVDDFSLESSELPLKGKQ